MKFCGPLLVSTLLLGAEPVSCTTAQLDASANAICAVATAEAAQYAGSTNPGVQVAVMAINTKCVDPAATVAQINAARVILKNQINGAKS